MRINHNVASLNAWRNMLATDSALGKSLERLSSGFRINRASDDAAGLAISEKMRAQITGLVTAQRNAQDAISLLQTAEGALNETHSILQRMRELAVQAANGTLTDADRAQLQKEVDQLIDEVQRIANSTEFNKKKLLTGQSFNQAKFQVGANNGQVMTVTISAMTKGVNGLGLVNANGSALKISTAAKASQAIVTLDTAIERVSTVRAKLGAYQNRLEHTITNLGVAAENLTAAESRIRDVDMAKEMTEFTKNQILIQAGTAMLAQANMKPQSVLKLLG